ncbi:TOMM precursor leader peptide-binding protein [Nostocoides sp. F2B08]|uniref:TOMM precursor leader peptide-binding protein n=1 Tax=Nostocoides sp. F2B08 TaxID=2653936 RepID=UPI0012634534|nr:TOMM precursor leader peptide-binding protein [Tetrasphaera sp. F2B08]KAB7741885.1 TOMM precursor leader peptide-binding protein [Tetrasphaera sp. F2B08]
MTAARYFRLSPGVEVVEVGEDRFTLRSEFDAFDLSGSSASTFAREVLTHLHDPMLVDDIVGRLPGFSHDSVMAQLERLAEVGLLREVQAEDSPSPDAFTAFIAAAGYEANEVRAVLSSLTAAVFGLESHGALLAAQLVRLGLGEVRLIDPLPATAAHRGVGVAPADDVGRPLQDAVAAALGAPATVVTLPGVTGDDAEGLREALTGCDLAFACWDQANAAATHRLNRVALDVGVPVLYSELRATSTLAGPLVLPGRSACWMCYRMRHVAAAPDFGEAMAFEEHLDRSNRPALATRPSLPPLAQQLSSALAMEALRVVLELHQPIHVDTVVEYDGLSGALERHPVLTVPDCPVCRKKALRDQPPFDELVDRTQPRSDLLALVERLVDPQTGIVVDLSAVPREPTESPLPHIWRARVANHRFLPDYEAERATSSGKGMTIADAHVACLGEAVERYSGACWSADDFAVARRSDLDGPSLDPRALVLYAEEQYADHPYAPYRDGTELTWFRCRSLVGGELVWVAASAVVMDFPVPTPEEFLFPITSNGLAAGATLQDAVLGALCEVLERDAMLISWYNRLSGTLHDAMTHPDDDVRTLARLWQRRGLVLDLIRLPTDHPVSVFMGVLRPHDPTQVPAAVVGLGADIDPLTAARKAALEVGQVRPTFARHSRTSGAERARTLLEEPSALDSLEDHALLYSLPEMAESFGFLRGEVAEWPPSAPASPAEALSRIVESLATDGHDVLYANLTPPDMAGLGLHTARVIVPEFQPISFGRGERRLGGSRLFDLPVHLGLRTRPATIAELNPLPHPIA